MNETSRPETKRDRLRRKVNASQAQLAKSALPDSEPPEGFKALAMDYPFALVLGGIALGAIAGAVLPRSAGRKLARAAVAAAGVAGELSLAYGRQALDAAGAASDDGRRKLAKVGDKLSELGETVGEGAGVYGRKAAGLAGNAAKRAAEAAGVAAGATANAAGKSADAAGDVADSARETGLKLARQVIRLASQMRH